jgi:hypothetical protein
MIGNMNGIERTEANPGPPWRSLLMAVWFGYAGVYWSLHPEWAGARRYPGVVLILAIAVSFAHSGWKSWRHKRDHGTTDQLLRGSIP